MDGKKPPPLAHIEDGFKPLKQNQNRECDESQNFGGFTIHKGKLF